MIIENISADLFYTIGNQVFELVPGSPRWYIPITVRFLHLFRDNSEGVSYHFPNSEIKIRYAFLR